jgi:hypothetical protein
MAFLSQIGLNIIDPLIKIWEGLITTVPGIVAALIILIVGYLVAWVIGFILDKALHQIKLDKLLVEKTHVGELLGDFRLTHFLAMITKWYVFILFLPPAASLISLPPLSSFLSSVALWIPNIILAVIIALVGFMAAHYTEWKILDTRAKTGRIVAYAAKVIIIVFTLLIVLDQIGVKIAIAQTSFIVVLAGVMLAIALMLGIGFGMAFKDEAKGIITQLKRKI